jgi:hypothetical protein
MKLFATKDTKRIFQANVKDLEQAERLMRAVSDRILQILALDINNNEAFLHGKFAAEITGRIAFLKSKLSGTPE